MNVLVTGGSGFLGSRLKKHRSDWIYLSSKDCNLISEEECDKVIRKYKPDAILHLAAIVGGIKDNAEKQAVYYHKNTLLNTNIIHSAYKNGVSRVLSCLSTCAFPNKLESYPFDESCFLRGPPASTNLSYGYTKRGLHIQSISYRKQYGLNYSTFCPSNIYGPGAHFNPSSSHFIAALISKVSKAKDAETIELWGTGNPLRQHLYVDDLCEIIPKLLVGHNTDLPLIVTPGENLSIRDIAEKCIKISGKSVKIRFNERLDGQFRKDGSNKNLLKIIGNFRFTTMEEGLKKTYEWYEK